MKKEKITLFLDYSAKALLLILTVSLLVFALMSGFENGGSFKNIPNAFPWIILFIFICSVTATILAV